MIAPRTLAAFWSEYPEAEEPLRDWLKLAQKYDFRNFAEIKEQFGSADWVFGKYIVFNIGGNKFRLVIYANFPGKRFYIEAILTHKQYDEWTRKMRSS